MRFSLKFSDKKDKLAILLCFVCVVAQSWLDLKIPEYISIITLRVQTSGVQPSDLLQPGSIMLACAFGSLVIAILSSYLMSGVSSNLTSRMRSAFFAKTMSFSLAEMGQFRTSSLITRCTKNIQYIYMFWSSGVLYLMKAVVLAALAIVKMAGSHVAWVASTGVSVVLTLLLMSLVFAITVPKMLAYQTHTDDANRLINEHIGGIRVIHAFNAEKYDEQRFSQTNRKMTDIKIFMDRGMAFILPGMMAIIYGLTVSIYWIGAGIISGDPADARAADYANMIAFSSYAMLCVQAFVLLVRGVVLIPALTSSVKRVREVINTETKISDGSGVDSIPSQPAAVEFRHVSFRYEGASADAVSDISFTAQQGQTVAFIGATGCGKTTLLNLIPRLYDVTKGEILINGIGIKDYQLSQLRGMIGYVPQKASLFSRTIAQNIDFGDSGGFAKSLTEIEQAAKVGQADEFIRQKPGGYDMELLPGGNNLSGGQKQRLTISRAVCRDPQIYLFDDSFSALDFSTDRKLRKALKKHAKGATVLVVAQRISTIRGADKIIVLDDGRIVGCGTHDELMNSCAVYREIAQTQQMSESDTQAGGKSR